MKKTVTKVAKPKNNTNVLFLMLAVSLIIMAAALVRMKNSLDNQSSAFKESCPSGYMPIFNKQNKITGCRNYNTKIDGTAKPGPLKNAKTNEIIIKDKGERDSNIMPDKGERDKK